MQQQQAAVEQGGGQLDPFTGDFVWTKKGFGGYFHVAHGRFDCQRPTGILPAVSGVFRNRFAAGRGLDRVSFQAALCGHWRIAAVTSRSSDFRPIDRIVAIIENVRSRFCL
jgi:hypothetical protein